MGEFEGLFEKFRGLLDSLDEKQLLSYWIKGEYEEAEAYMRLARRAQEIGLPENVAQTFAILAKDSVDHGKKLKKIYVSTYGEEPEDVDVPGLEAEVLKEVTLTEDNVLEVLKLAMESELLARDVYIHLASNTSDERLKGVYLHLARIEEGHYRKLSEDLKFCRDRREKG